MIPVLTGQQVRELDRITIERYQVPSLELMEAAGRGAYEFLDHAFPSLKKAKVLVLCGKGNNGGDGFVLARYLKQDWVETSVATIESLKDLSSDATTMARKLKGVEGKLFSNVSTKKLPLLIKRADLIVDALLGTGIAKPVRTPYRDWIELVNQSGKPVLALDIPSGLSADRGKPLGAAIQATWTATMGFMKLGLVLPPGCDYAGQVEVIDIGIPQKVQKQVTTPYRLVEYETIRASFRRRKHDTHKGSYGHVLVIAGSPTKLGAALMTAKTCLRVGAGLSTLALPKKAYTKIPPQFLELMYEPVQSAADGTFASTALMKIRKLWKDKSVLAVGPGIGVTSGTRKLMRSLVLNSPVPMVIDADGINSLVGQLDCLRQAASPLVLTPHPGEMARLAGISTQAVLKDRLKRATDFASKHQVTIVLKGFRTITAFPEGKAYINPTGNPGMATAGMGDVLTGIIAGLIAQKLDWLQAITAAVYLHGLAGDRLAERMGDRGLLAGDLIDSLPFVLKEFVPRQRHLHLVSK